MLARRIWRFCDLTEKKDMWVCCVCCRVFVSLEEALSCYNMHGTNACIDFDKVPADV